MRKLVLIDMDEVLVEFVRPWMLEYRPTLPYAAFLLDDWKGARNVQDRLGMPQDEWWALCSALTVEWWADLPWTTWGRDLLDLVEGFGVEWALLSAPGLCPNSATGKVLWVEKNLGDQSKLILANRKELLARPGVLLIDDMHHNVDRFRANGGQATLVPQPWNDETRDPLECVRVALWQLMEAPCG